MMSHEQLIDWLQQLSRHKARLASAEKIVNQGMVSLQSLAASYQSVSLFDGRKYELDAADVQTLAAIGHDAFRRSVGEQVARAEGALASAARDDLSGLIRSLLEVAAREKDYPEPVRTAGIDFIVEKIGEGAIDECVVALGSADDSFRFRAVLVLMFVPSARTIAPLLTALNDADKDVRFLAATALGKKKATEAIERLRSLAVSDPADRVQAAARKALSELGIELPPPPKSSSPTTAPPPSAPPAAPVESAPLPSPSKRWWQFWK